VAEVTSPDGRKSDMILGVKLHIVDEFSPLKVVAVAWGNSVPAYEGYASSDPEFTKYHQRTWDKELLLRQQDGFFSVLSHYDVQLQFVPTAADLPWQMYTRDTGFVVGDTFYFAQDRGLQERAGEITAVKKLLDSLQIPDESRVEIAGKIEGGDVLISSDGVLVGNGSRTNSLATTDLLQRQPGKMLFLGQNVMHLDTRLTLLPNQTALVYPAAFTEADLAWLSGKYRLITVLEAELMELGTNVFVINPEIIVSPTHNRRINEQLRAAGFKLETVDYTQPINLGGSFRCTTMPLVRA
jgi:N-dimethylarginine dimethylaminohydrolase